MVKGAIRLPAGILAAAVVLGSAACSTAALEKPRYAPGPRGPIGPDVPLDKREKQFLGSRAIAVQGRTAKAIQAACSRASAGAVVFLPAGEYEFEETVNVPAGVTILGSGAKTHCISHDWARTMFEVSKPDVRITRLRIEGPCAGRDTKNTSTGVNVSGAEGVRIDHCEIFALCRGVNFSGGGGQVDHCNIHHCVRDGLGYGISLYSGARVLICDSDFSQCRHSLASNGALDWSSPKRVGKYLHKAGVRKTHWEFVHNHVGSNDLTQYELCAVDTHPGMDGVFVVESCLFENLRHAVGIRDGSGLIRWNLFRNFRGKSFRTFIGISISYGTHNNVPVDGCMPHDIEVAGNVFVKVPEKYRIGKAENITIDGKPVEKTWKGGSRPRPAIIRLKPMTPRPTP